MAGASIMRSLVFLFLAATVVGSTACSSSDAAKTSSPTVTGNDYDADNQPIPHP
jgi:hypothetical protein